MPVYEQVSPQYIYIPQTTGTIKIDKKEGSTQPGLNKI